MDVERKMDCRIIERNLCNKGYLAIKKRPIQPVSIDKYEFGRHCQKSNFYKSLMDKFGLPWAKVQWITIHGSKGHCIYEGCIQGGDAFTSRLQPGFYIVVVNLSSRKYKSFCVGYNGLQINFMDHSSLKQN